MIGVAPEDGIRVAATGAAVGFDTVWYRQTAGGHVAGACREESYFLCCSHVMLSTPRLNPKIFFLSSNWLKYWSAAAVGIIILWGQEEHKLGIV